MVKRSERNTGTKCWRDGGVRRIVWKADGTRGVGRAVVEASVIVMERMWREPGRGEREGGDGLAINFGARSVAHMCTGYAFGKSEEHTESWIGREKLFLSSALRVKICQEKKKIYIYVYVYV